MTLVAQLDINFSNFTRDGIIRVAMLPYYSILGNFTWGIILGFIGAGLYANERSLGTIFLYLLLVGIFFAIILPAPIMYLFGLIFAVLVGIVFFKAYIRSR